MKTINALRVKFGTFILLLVTVATLSSCGDSEVTSYGGSALVKRVCQGSNCGWSLKNAEIDRESPWRISTKNTRLQRYAENEYYLSTTSGGRTVRTETFILNPEEVSSGTEMIIDVTFFMPAKLNFEEETGSVKYGKNGGSVRDPHH